MQPLKLGLIGGGNMAGAVISGLRQSGWPGERLQAAEPRAERRQELETQFGIHCAEQNQPVAAWAEALVFAVKPGVFAQAAREVASAVRPDCLIISLAAGVRCAAINGWFGRVMPVVRVMPNTPALINRAVCGVYATPEVSASARASATAVLEALGSVVWLADEALIDSVTGVSGSGPAYFFRLMELMEQSACAHGLAPEAARKLVIETALGAAQLSAQSELPLSELRKQVTSPGGTTEAALARFAALGFTESVREGVSAAVARARELGEESEIN